MSPREPSRRLFFALWPTEAERASMVEAALNLLQGSNGRAVPGKNLHVTLAFLGSVAQARVDELASIAGRVAESGAAVPPVRVSFTRVEYWKKARVVCAVPSSGAQLAGEHAPAAVADCGREWVGDGDPAGALAAALRTDLVAAGFTPDLKPFRAHVTLARKVSRRSDWKLCFGPVSWRFAEFSLVESRTSADGALYSVVQSWQLARAPFA